MPRVTVTCPYCGKPASYDYTQKTSGQMIRCASCAHEYRALDQLEKATHEGLTAKGFDIPAPRPNPSGPTVRTFLSGSRKKRK